MSHSVSKFGVNADRYVTMIDSLCLDRHNVRYTFMPQKDFKQLIRKEPEKGMQVYWREILSRAHLAATTSILRGRRWIQAISSAVTENNALAFSAAYRGLIESAADTHTALEKIPTTFARDFLHINQALDGRLVKKIFVVKEIEDDLIHYSHARKLKRGELAPASHKAKSIRDYMTILEKGKMPHVVSCYSALCDLTHPGASSVWAWLRPVNEWEFDLVSNQDSQIISRFLSDYRTTYLETLMFVFNGPLLSLSARNYFPIQDFHTPELLQWEFSNIPIWRKIKHDLGTALPQVKTELL